MKLTRVTLENFRSFERADLDLTGRDDKPLGAALLVGANGSGKSSILAAISGVFQRNTSPFTLFAYSSEELTLEDLQSGKESGSLAVQIEGSTRALNLHFRRAEKTFVQGPLWFHDLADVPKGYNGLIVGFDAHRWLAATPIDGPNIQRVPQHRLEGALAPTISPQGAGGSRFGQLLQWLVNIDFRRAKAKADRGEEYPTWELLRQGLNRLMKPYTFEGVDDSNRALFRTPHGLVPVERLSDGFRSIFVIVAEMMMRLSLAAEDQSRMLEGEAVCLIDELDAHLHPNWQLNVLPGLRLMFPNVQFIATTHSPLVLSTASPEEIFYIGPEEDL